MSHALCQTVLSMEARAQEFLDLWSFCMTKYSDMIKPFVKKIILGKYIEPMNSEHDSPDMQKVLYPPILKRLFPQKF